MFNSFVQEFGPADPNRETSDMFGDMSCEICGCALNNLTKKRINEKKLEREIRETIESFFNDEEANQTSFSQLDKAELLEGAFHYANENFYIAEDEGWLADRHEAQDAFLSVLTKVLKSL